METGRRPVSKICIDLTPAGHPKVVRLKVVRLKWVPAEDRQRVRRSDRQVFRLSQLTLNGLIRIGAKGCYIIDS